MGGWGWKWQPAPWGSPAAQVHTEAGVLWCCGAQIHSHRPPGDVELIDRTEHPQKALWYSHGAQEDNLSLFPVMLWLLALKVLLPKGQAPALGLGGAGRSE